MSKYIYCLLFCGNSINLLLSICDNDFVCGLCYIGLYSYKYTDNESGVIIYNRYAIIFTYGYAICLIVGFCMDIFTW